MRLSSRKHYLLPLRDVKLLCQPNVIQQRNFGPFTQMNDECKIIEM